MKGKLNVANETVTCHCYKTHRDVRDVKTGQGGGGILEFTQYNP